MEAAERHVVQGKLKTGYLVLEESDPTVGFNSESGNNYCKRWHTVAKMNARGASLNSHALRSTLKRIRGTKWGC